MDRTVARLGPLADALGVLPPVIADPLREWATEADPRMALWHACDAVEMALRLAVALGIGDWARAGGMPPELRPEIARRLEQPTLGRWRGMALALAAKPAPATPLGALWSWVTGTIEPVLAPRGEQSVGTSLTELRNRLAHGGGLPHALADELLGHWEPRLAAAFAGLAALADVRLVAVRGGDPIVIGPDDGKARKLAAAWAATRKTTPDAVVAVRGATVMPLWPLVVYASPAGEPRAVPQVYVRRGEVRLVMTPLGAERAAVAESSDGAVRELVEAGLLGDPPPRPPVEPEVPGFEAELKRDAGQCVGRDAEVAAVAAAVTAGAPGLLWLAGAAGSGKSLVLARVVREAAPVPALIAFRFKAGDVRCSRETFLRFLVERAAIAIDTAAPRGKPLKEQARELCAAAGARLAMIVDGVDDIVAIDPGFVAEVLAPLARAVRVVAAGRPEAAAVAAMTAAGAVEVFAGGLPPMTADDVRAMLLDKVGPLAKRLVALDADKGKDVLNPFIDAVIARAAGLPVYVSYVIGDLLAGRIRSLDATALPPSLGAYHAAVLRRGGAGAAQQLVTPLVATLALARAPLPAAALHALMVHRVLATDDEVGLAAVGDALAQLAGLVRRDDDGAGEARWSLFHPTLRDHVRGAPEQAMAIATARIALARAARELAARPGPLAGYLDDHAVAHLLEAGDVAGAAAAVAWPRIVARLGAHAAAALPRVLADLQAVGAHVAEVAELHAFVRGAAHHVERAGVTALIQAALADGDDSAITRAAEASAPPEVLRRLDRPARASRGARQRTLVGHAAAIRALCRAGDAIVSAAADGALRVWDADEGSLLRVLTPPTASLSAMTRATVSAAPADVSGAWPVLGVHALCAVAGGVIAAHGDGVLRLWDVDTGKIGLEQRIGTYAWSLAHAGSRLAAACDDGNLHVLEAATLRPLAVDEKVAARSSGDGRPYLAACAAVPGPGATVVVAGASRGLAIVDVEMRTGLGELRGHDAPARALATVPGTTWVLSAARDGTAALWDVATRALVARVAVPGGAWSVAPIDRAAALVGTRDGRVHRLTLPELALAASAQVHAGPVVALLALPDGRVVTGGEDRAVRLVDLDVAAAARPSHAGPVTALAALTTAAHGVLIVTGGADGAVKLWDARGRSLRTIPAHPSGVTAVAAIGDGDDVVIHSAGGVAMQRHRLHAGAVTSAPLPDAAAPVHGLVARSPEQVVATAAGELAVALWGPRAVSGGTDTVLRAGDVVWRGHTWDVLAIAAAGDTVASAGKEGVVIVWDPATGKPRLTRPGPPSRCLAVSPDGARVASATRDDCVVIWRAADGGEEARWSCDAPPQLLAFADDRTLVIGDVAGEILVLAL